MRDYVGEQYLSAVDSEAVVRGARAAREATEQLRLEGIPVCYERSTFAPEDETCLHLYRADSLEAVQAAAARASLPLDRIADAIIDAGITNEHAARGLA
jgi:Protein of unknown function (DUF4242)